MREADTEGHTVWDSMDGKRPEQAYPETKSGFLVVRGWEGGTDHGNGISFGA